MRYMLNIYVDERRLEAASAEEVKGVMDAYEVFGREARDRGAFVAGDGLKPAATATLVQVRDGERLVTDGPFAETKEQLGGFYLLECGNLDEAIAWAAKIPAAQGGTIEVRPVMDYDRPVDHEATASASASA